MEEQLPKLGVVKRDRGGRRRYNEASKRALVEACLRPGVSVARKAQENGVNANLLRKWITRYLLEREHTPPALAQSERVLEAERDAVPTAAAMPNAGAAMTPAPFVPVVPARPVAAAASSVHTGSSSMALALHVRLPNGVRLDLDETNLETLSSVVQMLGRLPCSGSMQD